MPEAKPLHPDVADFVQALRRAEAFLRGYGETHWAGHLAYCAALAERSDARCLDAFHGLFGGMGSLNDFCLPYHFDKADWEADKHLHTLLERAGDAARRAARDE